MSEKGTGGPKVVITRFSELGKHNRMDAGFFVTLNEYKESIEQAGQRYTPERAREILNFMDLTKPYLEDILKLARGEKSRSKAIQAAIEEYPVETMGIVLAHQDELLKDAKAVSESAEEMVDVLKSL